LIETLRYISLIVIQIWLKQRCQSLESSNSTTLAIACFLCSVLHSPRFKESQTMARGDGDIASEQCTNDCIKYISCNHWFLIEKKKWSWRTCNH